MKRTVDIASCLMLALPVGLFVVLTGLIIWLIDGIKPFFRQPRVGKNGRDFTCFKLNTMRPPASEAEVNDKVRDAARVTRIGLWLRNRGLDELPQFWNILRGDMSFVGPRPLMAKNIQVIREKNAANAETIDAWAALRATVRPGLSGWHQVHSLGSEVVRYDTEFLLKPTLIKHVIVVIRSASIMIVGKKRFFRV